MSLNSLAEIYASKTDDELLVLAADPGSLVEEARPILRDELSRRNLLQGLNIDKLLTDSKQTSEGDRVTWRDVLTMAVAVAVSIPLALTCEILAFNHSGVTPGVLALVFIRISGPPRLLFIFPVDTACWVVVLLTIYAAIGRRKELLSKIAAPVAFVFAITVRTVNDFNHPFFTPGVGVWQVFYRVWHLDNARVMLLINFVVDSACWFAVFLIANKLIGRLRLVKTASE